MCRIATLPSVARNDNDIIMNDIGKILILFGGILALLGVVLTFAPKIPFLGKLPGDIHIEKENFHFYFPIATSILVSVLVTIVLHLFLGKK